jgi:hypothetical protein
MSTVLFSGSFDSKIEDMSRLYLAGITRDKNGNVIKGEVINGHWDLKITPKFVFSGSLSDGKYHVAFKIKKPELIVEVQVETKGGWSDYNEVIYEASKVLEANRDKLVKTSEFNYIKINCGPMTALKKKRKKTLNEPAF